MVSFGGILGVRPRSTGLDRPRAVSGSKLGASLAAGGYPVGNALFRGPRRDKV